MVIDGILLSVGVMLFALFTTGLIFSRLYTRSTKERAFVRTGMGGEKVVMNGGAIVLPVLHEVILVNMNTLLLEVRRANEAALITRNRMRVDVTAEFYVRVAPNQEAISMAAQTLGQRTLDTERLRALIEGKFVDVLRTVAAEMAMEELHEKRAEFVQRVRNTVQVDLAKNGLELESVSLTALDQTDPKYFRPENAFDAEGLTQLTRITEDRKRQRNVVIRDTEVEIQQKNLETQRQSLEISREEEYARLNQDREIKIRKAQQEAEIAQEQARRRREAEEAKIETERQVATARILAERAVKEEEIAKQRELESREIDKARILKEATIGKEKAVDLAEQVRAIAVAEKSKEESLAKAEANRARAEAVREEEQVVTVRSLAVAERDKEIQLVSARRAAEEQAIGVTVKAEADKRAAEDSANAARIAAAGQADAEKIRAEASKIRYLAEAEGKDALNRADNTLSRELIEMRVKLALIERLPAILQEAVKPMERIEGIKIYQVQGLTGGAGGFEQPVGGGSLADQVANAALRYKAQAPLVDSLLQELGLQGGDINGLLGGVTPRPAAGGPAAQ